MNTSSPSACEPARTQVSVSLLVLAVLFCVCLIVANLIEIKTVDLGGIATVTAGMVVFPISYIISDCIVEVYGFRIARLVIWLGFAMNLLATLLLQLALALPGDANWTGQEAMVAVYSSVPRILAASFTAFIVGSMVNAMVMSRMKLASGGRHFSLRAIVSTIMGEGADSLIFFPLAFGGVLPWSVVLSLIVAQTLLKTLYEVIVLPLTMTLVRWLKRREDMDTYDHGISYSWW